MAFLGFSSGFFLGFFGVFGVCYILLVLASAVFKGFPDRLTALRFESAMHLHCVADVREWLDVAHAIVEKYAEEFGGVSVM